MAIFSFQNRFLLILVLVPLVSGCGYGNHAPAPARVVLYCALDREFAEVVLGDFEKATGLRVVRRFDTEANKSVGLFQELVREAGKPRADVHWNNEPLATLRLQKMGLLESYPSPAGKSYPEQFRAADGSWHAFAARARILIVNTNLVPAADRPRSIFDLTNPRWRKQVAIAKPQFGTTATHAACLFQVWGAEKARKFFRDLKANEVRIVAGNKQVAEGVGVGQFAIGLTDTDDAFLEIKAGRPVAIIAPDRDGPADQGLGTLFLPNTLALLKGGPNPAGGRKLIDYLLGPEVETKLAHSPSRQIPLNPTVKGPLPPEIEAVRGATPMRVNFGQAAELWDEVQHFVKEEFLR